MKASAVKAAQIKNAPDYPVQNLYPCAQSPEAHVYWLLNTLFLTEGIMVRVSGGVSYAPAMVARMRMKTFRVWSTIDGFDDACAYKLKLVYTAKDGQHYEQFSAEIKAAEQDKFMFEVPIEHVDRNGWFTCALKVELTTPLTDTDECDAAVVDGIANPCHPVLIRGTYLEIMG